MDSEGLLAAYTYTLGMSPSSTSDQDKPELPAQNETQLLKLKMEVGTRDLQAARTSADTKKCHVQCNFQYI